MVTGNITGALAADETVVVFRDGVKVGTALVSNGSWSFKDAVTSGTFKYTAQVQDAAGNIGQMSSVLAVTLGTSLVEGTTRNDVLIGGGGATLADGRLADIAPTLLALLGQPQPDLMTGRSLLR